MHGFAGQLDLRKLSGVGKMPGWKIVSWTMLVGCLNLAGFPFVTSGFWSKDMIVGDAFANPHMPGVGWVLLLTAGLTAYYTFRVYFRVFVGPQHFEPGEEVNHGGHGEHGEEHGEEHGHEVHGEEKGHGEGAHAAFHPHPPGWAINTVLVVLAVSAFIAIALVPTAMNESAWLRHMVEGSTAGVEAGEHGHATLLGMDAHTGAMIASIIVGLVGIAIAWRLHYSGRTTAATSRADALVPMLGPIPKWAQNKWYVDEFYHFLIVRPLWVIAHICYLIDKLLVDGLVNLAGITPRSLGHLARRTQSGLLHDYALRMAGGVCLVLLIVWMIRGGLP